MHCVDASVQEESGRQGQHDGASAVRLQTVVDPVPRTVRIEPLLAHPQHLPFVAGLVYREFWAGVSGGLTEEYLARAFGGHAEPGRVLRSWLALEEDEPLGCVHLIDHDDDTLPELYPWLAAMVVLPGRRGNGIGSAFVRSLLCDGLSARVARHRWSRFLRTTGRAAPHAAQQ